MTFFLTHWCMLSTAWLVLAVFLWRGFRFPSKRSPYLFESPVGVLSHLHKTSRQTSPDPTGLLTFARLFLGQRRDGIALSLGKCRAGRCRYFPAFPFACQARCGRPHLRLVS
jgi:hypothetical protein